MLNGCFHRIRVDKQLQASKAMCTCRPGKLRKARSEENLEVTSECQTTKLPQAEVQFQIPVVLKHWNHLRIFKKR